MGRIRVECGGEEQSLILSSGLSLEIPIAIVAINFNAIRRVEKSTWYIAT